MAWPLDVDLDELRARRSAKWTTTPDDVLPLHVAEMDVRLATPITTALQAAVHRSDTGYAGDIGDLAAAFSGFARRRWRWNVAPDHVRTCADVAAEITETLRLLVAAGDAVVVMPPVYTPFWRWLEAVGARLSAAFTVGPGSPTGRRPGTRCPRAVAAALGVFCCRGAGRRRIWAGSAR